MAGHCECTHNSAADHNDPVLKRTLWFALVVNAVMFVVEIIASHAADSVSLKADALDFFSDAVNYAISLFVLSSSLMVRAKASMIKAASMGVFGLFVIISAISRAINGSTPEPYVMGMIGSLALFANLAVAWLLFRFRSGDSNMQSVWLCTRNDAIGNLAVILAGVGVFYTQARWPDLIVAMLISSLALHSAWKITILAKLEISSQT